jgi:hypothetical protein
MRAPLLVPVLEYHAAAATVPLSGGYSLSNLGIA